jgi:hypothetical protein
MTPRALRTALSARKSSWPNDPHELLAAVEFEADDHPGDPEWTAFLLGAHLLATAPVALPEGLLRDDLVRFDALSATWTARDAAGNRFLARVPRPDLTAVERRLLARDGRALAGLVDGLTTRDGALVAPLKGQAVAGPLPTATGIRLVATTLIALDHWRAKGFAPLAPGEEELREVEGNAVIVSLTPGPLRLNAWIRHLAFTLRPTGLLAPGRRGLVELPPATPSEAGERLHKALQDDLSARSTELRQRVLLSGHTRRRARLVHVLSRLGSALPPPTGDSAVGFDLEARPTRVVSNGQNVQWGSAAEQAVLYDGTTFDAPAARRLLRALATSPSTEGHAEAMGRWVSAGLRIRTLRLLLEKSG